MDMAEEAAKAMRELQRIRTALLSLEALEADPPKLHERDLSAIQELVFRLEQRAEHIEAVWN